MKAKWKPNKQFPNTYFAKANNFKEYFQLVKDLFREFDIVESFSIHNYIETKSFFDHKEEWHDYFETLYMDSRYKDDDYESFNLPDPIEYDGEINKKPDESEYPVIVIFDGDLTDIMWQSLNDFE